MAMFWGNWKSLRWAPKGASHSSKMSGTCLLLYVLYVKWLCNAKVRFEVHK